MRGSSDLIYVINPLPKTLFHYENALLAMLSESGVKARVMPSPSVEVGMAHENRALIALRSAWSRLRLLGRPRGTVIGLWPALGLLECLLYLPTSLRHDVLLIIHDPIPLRRQFGYSRACRFVARICTALSPRLTLVTHTRLAQKDLQRWARCQSLRLPHPLSPIDPAATQPVSDQPVIVRVLGQYKPSRDLEPLVCIARTSDPGAQLEILGRGWPAIEGWNVVNNFLNEDEFDRCIRTASCVVIPYARFYQSGVAARCAEAAVPIVGPAHEHLQELYGAEWPGLVHGGDGWSRAVTAALAYDRNILASTTAERRMTLHAQWTAALKDPPSA